MSKGWSIERRKAQAERCRANKPWEKSTGPQSEQGKAKSSMNAYKHGLNSQTVKELRKILRLQRLHLKSMPLHADPPPPENSGTN